MTSFVIVPLIADGEFLKPQQISKLFRIIFFICFLHVSKLLQTTQKSHKIIFPALNSQKNALQ